MATVTAKINPVVLAIVRVWHWVVVRGFLRVTIKGREHIPTSGPVILVPTHRSRLDALFLQKATARSLRPMTSHDEFVGPQGWFMRRIGAFPVDTRKPGAGAIKACRELLRDGRCLVIFAEGTIFYYGPNQVHPIKPGVAWIAFTCQKDSDIAKFPIVPVRLNYSAHPPTPWSRVEVAIQPPIYPSDFADLPRDQAQAALTARLQAAMGDTVNESLLEMAVPRTPPTPSDSVPSNSE